MIKLVIHKICNLFHKSNPQLFFVPFSLRDQVGEINCICPSLLILGKYICNLICVYNLSPNLLWTKKKFESIYHESHYIQFVFNQIKVLFLARIFNFSGKPCNSTKNKYILFLVFYCLFQLVSNGGEMGLETK